MSLPEKTQPSIKYPTKTKTNTVIKRKAIKKNHLQLFKDHFFTGILIIGFCAAVAFKYGVFKKNVDPGVVQISRSASPEKPILQPKPKRETASVKEPETEPSPLPEVKIPIDPILAEAKRLDTEITNKLEIYYKALTVTGRILRAQPWSEFPEVRKALISTGLESSAGQLLQVDVGEPALLVTTKTNYETTGQFYMKALRLTNIETNFGKTIVLIEFAFYDDLKTELTEKGEKIRELALTFLKRSLPKNLNRAQIIKEKMKSDLDVGTIAALLAISNLEKDSSEGGGMAFYMFKKAGALCRVEEKLFTKARWKVEFNKLNPVFEWIGGYKRDQLFCTADELVQKEKEITFWECMCEDDGIFFYLEKYKGTKYYKEYQKFLDQIETYKPDPVVEKVEEPRTPIRLPANSESVKI